MAQLFHLPREFLIDANAATRPNAKAYFFETNTANALDTYTTDALNVAHQNPVLADSFGVFPAIYLDPARRYKLTLNTAADALIYTQDPVNDSFTAGQIGAILYPRTTAEIAAGVTPTSYGYPAGDLRRYGAIGNGITNDVGAIQQCIDCAQAGQGSVYVPPLNFYCASSLTCSGADVYFHGDGFKSRLSFAAGMQLAVTASNVRLHNFRLSGPDAAILSDRESDSILWIHGASSAAYIFGVSVSQMWLDNARGAGALMRFVYDFEVSGCHIQDIGYAGIGIESCNDGFIGSNRIFDINAVAGNANAYGVYLSQDGTLITGANPVCEHIAVSGNVVSNVSGWTGIDTHCGRDITISDNVITGVVYGIAASSGSFDVAPDRVSITGNALESGGGYATGYGITLAGVGGTPGTVGDYATDLIASGNVISRFGFDNDVACGIYVEATAGAVISGNTIREPSRHGITLSTNNQGFAITGNVCVDPFGTAGAAAFIRIPSDYNKGFIGGNAMIRGTKSAANVAAQLVNRSGSTFTNSDIDFGYNYSQHQSSLYSNIDSANFEHGAMRDSEEQQGTFTLTLTGMTGAVTGTAHFHKRGQQVTLQIPSATGTSNTTAMTGTGLPAILTPGTSKVALCRIVDNGVADLGIVTVSGTTLTFDKGITAAVFTNSGTKGAADCSFTYGLD